MLVLAIYEDTILSSEELESTILRGQDVLHSIQGQGPMQYSWEEG